MTNNSDHIFSNVDIRKLLIPIMLENLLASLMGTVDTMMVSNVGASAVSAVSLVDSINILVIQALSALAARLAPLGLLLPMYWEHRIAPPAASAVGFHISNMSRSSCTNA